MMAMTTSSSISVKPRCEVARHGHSCGLPNRVVARKTHCRCFHAGPVMKDPAVGMSLSRRSSRQGACRSGGRPWLDSL